MIDCMILGDSIAVGTGVHAHGCEVHATSGWNSWQWNKKYMMQDKLKPKAKHVIISLGTNDHKGVNTEAELAMLRVNVTADRVYWILPAIKPNVQDIVRKIAQENGDVVLPITSLQPDGIHPSSVGYKALVKAAK